MKDHKYTTIFSSTLKALVSEEKDQYLAMASLVDIGDFIPEVDTNVNFDLLPIAFNACVVNRVNKNGDVINTKTALSMYKSFINKPINIEHNREKVIGTILTAGFSEFGTDKSITEDQVKEMTAPFNITLGGVIWKVANSALADLIEEAADPSSEHYMRVSASWELGFADYNIMIVSSGEKNIENAEIIDDESKIEILNPHLKSYGGSGELEDGRSVFRQVINEVVPLGIGLTESPAADVVGVAVKNEKEEDPNDDETEGNAPEKPENGSQKPQKDVNETKEINKTGTVIMKITSLNDITDESLQALKASTVADFIEEEIKKASEKYAEDVTQHEKQAKEIQEKHENLSTKHESVLADLDTVKEKLNALEAEKAAKEAEEMFNQRMSAMDEEYALDDQDREIIAMDVKDLTEEEFDGYQKKMAVLLSSKSKKTIEAAKTEAEAKEKSGATAKVEEAKPEATPEKVETSEAEVSEVVNEVVDNAEVEKGSVPNSIDASEDTVYNKYRNAFGIDQFEILT